jgi:hypothetical protein
MTAALKKLKKKFNQKLMLEKYHIKKLTATQFLKIYFIKEYYNNL